MRSSKWALGLALALATWQAHADAYFPARGQWQQRAPATLGIDPVKLDTAVQFATANEFSLPRDLRLANMKLYEREPNYRILGPMRARGGPAGVIVKDGYIVAQWGDVERVDMTFSVVKSYLSSIAGLAWDAGLIRVDEAIKNYVWDGTFDGVHNGKIRWEHLLNQSSDWQGNLFGLDDWADRPPADGAVDDWRNRALHEPGTVFEYNDVRVNLLAYALLNVWRKPLPLVLKENIMDPIGASTSWRWYGYDTSWIEMDGVKMNSVSGGGHFGGGLFIDTLDQARYGLLMARKGRWQSRQLLSAKWLALATTPSPAKANYGYLWWLNRGDKRWQKLSPTIYYADGVGGNYIVIDSERDLVIVTRWLQEDMATLEQLLEKIDAALPPKN